jgi:hypothetical protein
MKDVLWLIYEPHFYMPNNTHNVLLNLKYPISKHGFTTILAASKAGQP